MMPWKRYRSLVRDLNDPLSGVAFSPYNDVWREQATEGMSRAPFMNNVLNYIRKSISLANDR